MDLVVSDNLVNVPLEAGMKGKQYMCQFERYVIPAIEKFEPSLILISAGFDAHKRDCLASVGGLCLDSTTFVQMTKRLCELADKHGSGRIVSLLEGGYNEVTLGDCVTEHVKALAMHKSKPSAPSAPPSRPAAPKAQLFAPKTHLNAKAVLVEQPIGSNPLPLQPAGATNTKLHLPEATENKTPARLNYDDSVVVEKQNQLEDEVAQFRETKQRELEEAVEEFRMMRQMQLRKADQIDQQEMAPPNKSIEAMHRHCSTADHEAQEVPKKRPREDALGNAVDGQVDPKKTRVDAAVAEDHNPDKYTLRITKSFLHRKPEVLHQEDVINPCEGQESLPEHQD